MSSPGDSGYLVFVWVYGLFLGGYHYSLKMFVFQKVRARNFPSAWGFVQLSQALSVLVGVPITGYINYGLQSKAGYYFSAVTVLAGGGILALIDLQRRLHRNKRKLVEGSMGGKRSILLNSLMVLLLYSCIPSRLNFFSIGMDTLKNFFNVRFSIKNDLSVVRL